MGPKNLCARVCVGVCMHVFSIWNDYYDLVDLGGTTFNYEYSCVYLFLSEFSFLVSFISPMFTVELSREEQREMSLWPLVWSTGFHQYRNRWLWGLSSQRMVSGSENQIRLSCHLFSQFHFLNFPLKLKFWETYNSREIHWYCHNIQKNECHGI